MYHSRREMLKTFLSDYAVALNVEMIKQFSSKKKVSMFFFTFFLSGHLP